MTRASGVAALAGLCWPLASHAAAVAGRPAWIPAITAITAIILLGALGIDTRGRLRIALAAGAGAALLMWFYAPMWLVFAPPVAINAALGCFFASTLRAGSEPRIARYARIERGGELPWDLARYTRHLTWIWSVWFFAAATVSAALALATPLAVWSAFANVGSYIVVGILFVGEYLFRKFRFPHHRHASLRQLVAVVVSDRPLSLPRGTR